MASDKQFHRVQRVEKEIQVCLSSLLINQFQRRWNGILTISRIQMPSDLKTANIFIHFFGSEKQKEDVLATLKKETRFLQEEVSHKLKLRYTPKFTFQWDLGYETSIKVDRVLRELGSDGKKISTGDSKSNKPEDNGDSEE